MNEPLKVTLLAGIEPTPRAIRAHAMRNCVSVIVAVSDLVERELGGACGERWARLRDDVFRLRALVSEELRDEARLAANASALSRPCCVTTLVSGVIARLADRAESAGVTLVIDCDGGVMFGDEGALAEALFNLISNAIEASRTGGSVFLSTFETSDGDQYWVLRDTGRGMEPHELANLGRALDPDRTRGSGFGIAVARAVLARQGGLMSVESTDGSGTTVTMWLPRRSVPVSG
jgi:signal transduction histidine kinase